MSFSVDTAETSESLFQNAQKDQGAAWFALMTRANWELLNAIHSRFPRLAATDADDVVARAFDVLYQRRSELRSWKHAWAYVKRTACFMAYHVLRDEARYVRGGAVPLSLFLENGFDFSDWRSSLACEELEAEECLSRFAKTLDQMGRQLFSRMLTRRDTPAQSTLEADLSPATVRRRMQRIRKRLLEYCLARCPERNLPDS